MNIFESICYFCTFEKDFFNKVVKKIAYLLPVLLCLTISFLFSITNRTISVDDMMQYYYYFQGEKIQELRWGQVLANRIFSTPYFTPASNEIIGVVSLFFSATFLCSILYYLNDRNNKVWLYTVFSCIFVSYPLINEFWEYYECLTIPFNFFIVAMCLAYELVNECNISSMIISGVFMSIIMSGYESLVFVYITIVFSILFIKYCLLHEDGSWILEGLKYVTTLVVALVIRYVVGYMLLWITGLQKVDVGYGAMGINWINLGFMPSITQLLYNGFYYGIRALTYLPITEFVVATIVFILVSIKLNRKHFSRILISLLLLVSLFFLPIIQGSHFGYRMAQTVHYFVCFVAYVLLYLFNGKKLFGLLVVLLMIVAIRQSVYLNNLLALDHLRSENETNLIRNIGNRIYSECDISKDVVFVGTYDLSKFINQQITVDYDGLAGKVESAIRKKFNLADKSHDLDIVSTNVNSLINWSKDSFDEAFDLYFSYCGYDISVAKIKDDSRYKREVEEKNIKPLEIVELDDYILVYLGN